MDKREFLNQLEEALLRLSKSDRDDILLDYEEHFRAGEEKGMTEAEVAASLGEPSAIAAQYLENLPEDAKGAPVILAQNDEPEAESASASEETAAPQPAENAAAADTTASTDTDSEPSAGQKAANVAFWIGAVIGIGYLIYLVIGLIGTIIGCFAGAVSLMGIAAFFTSSYISIFIGFLLIAVGLICMGVLLIIGAKYAIIGIKKLIGVCKKTSRKILGRE